MAAFIPSIASGLSSIIGGIVGSNGSKGASRQAVQGDQNAISVLNGGLGTNIGNLGQQEANLSPYTSAGTFGINQLVSGLSPGGQFTQTMSPDEILKQDPGYNFQLQQGEQQVQRAAAAGGTGISGGELKDATTYSQNLAQNAYQQAFQNFNQTQNQNFSRLLGVTGIGQQEANVVNQDQTQTELNSLGINSQVAGLYQNEGQANAAGTLGSASSINQMLSGLSSAVGQGYSASQLSNPSLSSSANTTGMTTPIGTNLGAAAPSAPPTTPLGVNYGDMVGLGQSSVANGAPTSNALPYGY